MSRTITLLVGATLMLSLMAIGSRQVTSCAARQQSGERPLTEQERAIKIKITTGGGMFGPVKEQYRVGQGIPVTISMTNTSSKMVQVCVTGTLYQDLPKLLKDGKLLSYKQAQQDFLRTAATDNTCETLNLPEPIWLKPDEPKVVDGFVLAEGTTALGSMSWYEPLQAGKYELSIQRRTGCCDGPMIESNKINFEVVP